MFNPFSIINSSTHKYIIFDSPRDSNIDIYINELKKNNVSTVVRTCHSLYPEQKIINAGIKFINLEIDDGGIPSKNIIEKWLKLLDGLCGETIGVHCIAGLGRAPLLVCIALIENGIAPLNSIIYVREKRKYALNTRQIQFLKNYKIKMTKSKMTKCIIL